MAPSLCRWRLDLAIQLFTSSASKNDASMPFDFDTSSTFIEKAIKAIDWIVEEIFRQKNWSSLLVLIDVVLYLCARC